jgi:formate hydrogenlyase subunit 3/multisubunit Na+/H+ antiporter MnhD subunit
MISLFFAPLCASAVKLFCMEQFGRLLIIFGIVIAAIGLFLTFGSRLPLRLGRLPLDFHFQRDNFSFYFPLGTSILISVVLTIVFALLNRGR